MIQADSIVNKNSRKRVLTSEQVKSRLKNKGETITHWAERHGYSRKQVYRVLNGEQKGFYGQSHEIAKKLGLK